MRKQYAVAYYPNGKIGWVGKLKSGESLKSVINAGKVSWSKEKSFSHGRLLTEDEMYEIRAKHLKKIGW